MKMRRNNYGWLKKKGDRARRAVSSQNEQKSSIRNNVLQQRHWRKELHGG